MTFSRLDVADGRLLFEFETSSAQNQVRLLSWKEVGDQRVKIKEYLWSNSWNN